MPGKNFTSGKQRKKELQEKRAAKRSRDSASNVDPRSKNTPQAVTGKSFAPKKLKTA